MKKLTKDEIKYLWKNMNGDLPQSAKESYRVFYQYLWRRWYAKSKAIDLEFLKKVNVLLEEYSKELLELTGEVSGKI